MFNLKTLILRILPLAIVVLAACSNPDQPEYANSVKDNYVESILINISPTRDNSVMDEEGEDEIYEGITNPERLMPYSLDFDANTVVQVSQQTSNKEPFRNEEDIFRFVYMPGSVASWEDENTYNFCNVIGQKKMLEWSSIGLGGHYNGGFALYSLYFPVVNEPQKRILDNGSVIYSVQEDQSTIDNLKRSDILGAYHSTTALFSRIKFRLFHLMTYIRIRLYVPVFDEEKNTGYREGALMSATLNHVTPDFAIDWNALRSSDTQGPLISPQEGDGEIKMYLHPLPEGQTVHPITQVHYKDYLNSGYFDQGITGELDNVRVYDFSVIIPMQRGLKDEDNKESSFTETKFLNFKFKTNSGAETNYYFDQGLGADSNSSNLNMTQGIFQYLELYVPRVGNKIIYFGASVDNWNYYGTSMLLQEQK